MNVSISIHAPPRGATCTSTGYYTGAVYFNSRPSARGDGCRRSGIIVYTIFQFTPLREGRQAQTVGFQRRWYFNSRPSARGDVKNMLMNRTPFLFQFTPLREGRRNAVGAVSYYVIFQFTPLREGRPPYPPPAPPYPLFQFTPLREGRPGTASVAVPFFLFQFTPLREGRHKAFRVCGIRECISIHAPPRGATNGEGRCRRWRKHFNSRPSARGDLRRRCPR